jgi:hypothetical protein
LCYNRGMNLKETENFKFLANLTSMILLIVGLVLQDYIWLFASLLLKSTTISIVIYHKDQKPIGGFTQNTEERLVNELERYTITRPKQKTKAGL